MKKSLLTILLLTLIAAMAFGLAACGDEGQSKKEEQTLETYINSDPTIMEEVNSAVGDTEGLTIDITGNVLTYQFDLSILDGITEEQATSDDVKASLEDSLSQSASTFGQVCDGLETATKVTGIVCRVEYDYGDTVLCSKEFTSADYVPEDGDTAE